MDLHNAVELTEECGLEPATPAKPIPPRPYCLPNVTGFMRNLNVSSDSDTAVCLNDSEDVLNFETTCKGPENLFDNTPLKKVDSSGLLSGQITSSEGGRLMSAETSVFEKSHVHPNTESLQDELEGGKSVGAKFPKSRLKRQRVQKPIAKRYRPKIQDDRKPQKSSKSKHKRESSGTVDGIQPGKKRKYVKRSPTESASPNIPVSEIGNSPSLQPNTPCPLISEHIHEPLTAEHSHEPLTADHTTAPLADHVHKPVTAEHNIFHAKSCRRSLNFSIFKNPQHVDLSEEQHENNGEERATFKWGDSWNLPPQDFEDCAELKILVNQHIHEKKCNVHKAGSGIWKKRRQSRRRRLCFDNWNVRIAEISSMEVTKNKERVNKRTEALRRPVDSSSEDSIAIREDFSSTPLFDFSFVKRKRSSRSFVRNRRFRPVEENIECNVEAEGNSAKCNDDLQISCPEDGVPTISSTLAMLDSQTSENDVATDSQNGPEDATAKPLIVAINQEVGTPLIGDEDLQKIVLYENQNKALVQYKEKKKPQAEVDLDPELLEVWRLLTENGERTVDEVKESEKLRKLREVFRGRAEAFIATMREFLGNRRFSPWKGSVLDSLVGTFLTQNVSDHLSSSAFMSLRARYPPKHKRKDKDDNEEKTCIDSSVQTCAGVHEQTHDPNSELSEVCETRPAKESLPSACKADPHDLEKRDILRETLQVEENDFLEQYYDHQSGDVPTGLVERLPVSSSSEELLDKNSTQKILGTKGRKVKEEPQPVDWDQLRKTYSTRSRGSASNSLDSVDWEAVRQAPLEDIEATIQKRGQQRLLSKRIQGLLDRLVKDHGSTDLEWLRDVPPDKAKEFLLSINGIGLKSVECIRLLTLHHKAFPVDTNVARIAVRLGWVPLKPLPKDVHFHVLSQYPPMDEIQKYLWPALCTLDQETLYEFHYQLITFGKVFCPKISPNCRACPKKAECKHKASKDASDRLLLPGPQKRSTASNRASITQSLRDSYFQESVYRPFGGEPMVEYPSSPELEHNETPSGEAEDPLFSLEDDEMFINLNNMPHFSINFPGKIDFSQPLMSLSQEEALKLESEFDNLNKPEAHVRDIEDLPFDTKQEDRDHRMALHDNFKRSYLKHLRGTERSQALVAISPEEASKPNNKLKSAERLRTEHQVYELPDGHPVLGNLNEREVDDPSPYLFAIFRIGESSNSAEKPGEMGKPQNVDLSQPPTSTKSDIPEVQDQLRQTGKPEEVDLNQPPTFTKPDIPEVQDDDKVYGTILHPCKTALEGNFPLNGTYFQLNEVFADFASSQSLIGVPTSLLWNLPRRMLYCGTSAASIIKGSSEEGVRKCFCEGFICVRGFDNDTGAPRHLPDRLHHMPLNKGRKPDEWWG